MSAPYYQYTDHPNPATPHVYVWDASLATSEQDPTLQLQQQQVSQKSQAQTAQETPPAQLHFQEHLPSLPQNAQTSTPQEHQVQQQPQRQQYTAHQAIDQPSANAPQQPQYRFETMTEEDFMQANAAGARAVPNSLRVASGQRAASNPPPLHVTTSPASAPGTRSGVSQVRKHVQFPPAHPYRRSQSGPASARALVAGAGAGGDSPWGQQHAPVKLPGANGLQSAHASLGEVSPSHTGAALFPVGTPPIGVSCPASSTWHGELLGLGLSAPKQQILTRTGSSFRAAAGDKDAGAAMHHNLVNPVPFELIKPRQYRIRTDIHFSMENNVITAMFELPGIKRDDLQVTMSVCPFSRVRQVRVSGVSVGVLPLQGHQVRERKFGKFFRTLAVPPETKPEDISAELEDGILTLKIPGGALAQAVAAQDITIPIPVPQGLQGP